MCCFVIILKILISIIIIAKKAIRCSLGLPRISHTAEAFWALNMLPFRNLGIFNVIKFLFQLKEDQ